MITLIIPDIHTKFVEAEIIINHEKPDNIVFLGDYFDSFDDSIEVTKQVSEWLRDSMKKPNRIHLMGNHDLSYLDENYHCSGFSEGKRWAIRIGGADLSKLEMYCWVGDWLCTHAGLTRPLLGQNNYNNLFIEEWFKQIDREVLYRCSPMRGGRDTHSGILWCDYDEFEDIPNVKQIFGHTRNDKIRQDENHICLDTGLNHYAIYYHDKHNPKMTVKENLLKPHNTSNEK